MEVFGRQRDMDYSYLNQAAAAGFDSSCLQGAAMDPTGLGNMPCTYGDITSCSQMSQAAYRYTAAAASMARSYNPAGGAAAAAAMGVHHPGSAASQCAVMGARPHVQDVHRATAMFPSSMNLQSKYNYLPPSSIIPSVNTWSFQTSETTAPTSSRLYTLSTSSILHNS